MYSISANSWFVSTQRQFTFSGAHLSVFPKIGDLEKQARFHAMGLPNPDAIVSPSRR